MFRVYARIAVQAIMNPFEKSVPAFGGRPRARMPALVIKAPEECRQLGSEKDGLIPRQDIAQRMQGREQREINTLAIAPAKPSHEVVDPVFDRLCRGI